MLSATKVYFRISSRFAVLFCFVFSWKEERLSGREKWWRRREKVIKSKIFFFFFFFRVKKRRIVKREGETRISSLSLLVEIVGGCGGGEERISFRFERASSKLLLLENSVNFDDVSKAMTSPLSFALSPPQKQKQKKCVGVLFHHSSFGKKWEEKNTNLILHLSSFLQKLFK